MDAFDGSGLPLESRTPPVGRIAPFQKEWTSPLSVDRLTLPQIYGQISPRLMRPPCLRAKNARFPVRFARKPGGDELQACADDQLRQLSPLSPCGADGAKT